MHYERVSSLSLSLSLFPSLPASPLLGQPLCTGRTPVTTARPSRGHPFLLTLSLYSPSQVQHLTAQQQVVSSATVEPKFCSQHDVTGQVRHERARVTVGPRRSALTARFSARPRIPSADLMHGRGAQERTSHPPHTTRAPSVRLSRVTVGRAPSISPVQT